jgi:3-dehydroquinate synthase
MSTESATVTVPLGTRQYPVVIGAGLIARLGQAIVAAGLKGRCGIVTDTTVGALYGATVSASLEQANLSPALITIEHGEKSKSFDVYQELCETLARNGLDRHGFLVALGGGVVGDLAGLVAATYYRGVPYVQVPTTVMAQVDSAIGGKTGINLRAGKNLVGAFHQPRLVVADLDTLATLPVRERNEGFAEVIKYGVIKDATLFKLLSTDPAPLGEIVRKCVEIKAGIVAEDEFETLGTRALLNFGHTLGHGIETAAGYGRLLHGEAISLGMAAAGYLSVKLAGFSESDFQSLLAALHRFSLPLRLPADIDPGAILAATLSDKKYVRGKIRFVLARRLGEAFVSHDVREDDLVSALEFLKEFPA